MQIGGAGDTNYRREGQWAANISSGAQNCRWCQISDEGVTKSQVFWLKEDSIHKLDDRFAALFHEGLKIKLSPHCTCNFFLDAVAFLTPILVCE